MSRVAYSASKSEFMHDWENNLFMDKMREGARNNHIGGSPSEVNSWQNNAAKIYNLLKLSDAPADVFVAFEYKSPLAGRVDCMLFAKGTDGRKHIVHIELKQWSNGTVSQVYDTGVFKVIAQVGAKGSYQILSHPSQQALGYQRNIENYISMVNSDDAALEGCAYCYNYAYSKLPNDLFAEQYQPVMKVCPLHGSDGVSEFAAELKDILAGGMGAEIFKEFVSCPARPTKNLMNAAANMFKGQQEFVLLEDQATSANIIYGMVAKAIQHPEKKMALIVRGGPGTGKTVIALQVLSELARNHGEVSAYFTTRSKALRETLIAKLKKISTPNQTSAADLIRNIYTFRPAHFAENAVDVLLVDEAHRIRQSSNYMADRGMVKTFLPQTLSLLYTSKVCVFFIDDKQGVSREEIGSSAIIEDYAKNYKERMLDSLCEFKAKIEKAKQRLVLLDKDIVEIKKSLSSNPDVELEASLKKKLKAKGNVEKEIAEEYQIGHLKSAIEDIVVEEIELKSQFRCNGSDNYLDWLDGVIYKDEQSVVESGLTFGGEYEFGVFDTPQKLEEKIRSLNAPKDNPSQVARLVAGYCWTWSENLLPNGDLRKDVVIGDWSMPWETNQIPAQGPFAKMYAPSADLWASHPMGINQVGCIFSAQGFEVDYVGVILGPDVKFDKDNRRIVGISGMTHSVGKGDKDFDQHIKNIYRVLMSRGKRGCYIYCCDKALSEYFKALAAKADCKMLEEDNDRGYSIIEKQIKPEFMFVDYLPFYEMRAACGYFGNGELVEPTGWVRVDSLGRLNRNMFVVRASGQSMEPKIHDGDLCVFNARPVGTRQGKIVLVELHDSSDPETGGAYTIKKYQSEKIDLGYGEWTHSKICLHPLNPDYDTIVIEENVDNAFTVVAEFVKVLPLAGGGKYEG